MPVSEDQFVYNYVGTETLPKELERYVDFNKGEFSPEGRRRLAWLYGRMLQLAKEAVGAHDDNIINVILLPERFILTDKGKEVVGMAHRQHCAVLVAESAGNRLGATIAHELGHVLDTCSDNLADLREFAGVPNIDLLNRGSYSGHVQLHVEC